MNHQKAPHTFFHNASKLGPSIINDTKSQINDKKDNKRKFFKAAAALANPDLPTIQDHYVSGFDNVPSKSHSRLLEPGYQELVFNFYAPHTPLKRDDVDRMHFSSAIFKLERAFGVDAQAFMDVETIFDKYSMLPHQFSHIFARPSKEVYRNGVVFFPDEISSIFYAFVGMVYQEAHLLQHFWQHNAAHATELHQELLSLLGRQTPRSFVFSAHINGQDHNFTVDRAHLHWAYRLKKKSGQKSAGTDPSVKYFHAELLDSNRSERKVDLVYWLKFDANDQIIAGDFLNAVTKTKDQLVAQTAWLPHESMLNKLLATPFESSFDLIFSKVLGLYSDAML